MQNDEFKELLRQKGNELYRQMPWRDDTKPYYVLVSELMLQQTQVARVIPKFNAFVERFPNEQRLAAASLADVLKLWQGLGYNRRAKFLHNAAKMIVHDFGGEFPETHSDILKLPGVGKNTAGAIEAYAFNMPSIFIETNIRTVYIHHFFGDDVSVSDAAIIDKLTSTIDHEYPREFYWALMDYGSWLKASGVRNVSQSKQYKKQSALEGSVRQTRGQIIKVLTRHETLSRKQLEASVVVDVRFEPALKSLQQEGLVAKTGGYYHLTK